MRENINYYYNLNPDRVTKVFDYFYFYINSELFYFTIFDNNINNQDSIYNYNKKMINKNIIINELILNRNNSIITYINNIPYVLMKVFINPDKKITLSEISYLANINIEYENNLMRSNWKLLWCNKIDYLEYHHLQNYQKYPLLSACFDYFIGMAENAVSYLNDTILSLTPDNSDIGVTSHDSINIDDTIYSLYNPVNIIIDHKARDLAEYIKNSFFQDNFLIFDELDNYFKYNFFSNYGIHLLISRILYPSFYFNMYYKIISNEIEESSILDITDRILDYEKYLNDLFLYFKKYYNIKEIEWIKKEVNLH